MSKDFPHAALRDSQVEARRREKRRKSDEAKLEYMAALPKNVYG